MIAEKDRFKNQYLTDSFCVPTGHLSEDEVTTTPGAKKRRIKMKKKRSV